MDIFANIFHHGIIVDDIAAAQAQIGVATGAEWTPVRAFAPLRVWTPEHGRDEIWLQVAYSRAGPLRLELVEARPGTPYDRLRALSRSHIGVWVDSVGQGIEQLCAQGWRLLFSGAPPERGYGSMAYLAREGAPVIELVGNELRPVMQEWWDS